MQYIAYKEETIIYNKQYIFATILTLANELQESYSNLDGITIKQFMLINQMNNAVQAEFNLNELANLISSTRQNTKQLVQVLAKKGYLIQIRSIIDRRQFGITLSSLARGYLVANEKKGEEILEELFAGLSVEETSITRLALEKISNNLKEKKNNL